MQNTQFVAIFSSLTQESLLSITGYKYSAFPTGVTPILWQNTEVLPQNLKALDCIFKPLLFKSQILSFSIISLKYQEGNKKTHKP